MGDRRTIIGIIVSFLVLFAYLNFIYPRIVGREPAPGASPPAAAPAEPAPAPPPEAAGPAAATTQPAQVTTEPAMTARIAPLPEQKLEEDIVVETELFRVVLTNRGAAIKSVGTTPADNDSVLTRLAQNLSGAVPTMGPQPGQM